MAAKPLITTVTCLLALGASLPTTAAAAAAKHHHAPAKHHRVTHRVSHRHLKVRRASRHSVTAKAASVTALPKPQRASYFVSSSGSDSNSGTSPAQAWRTVGRVNRASLHPGDGVFFQGGQTFSDDVLQPQASGSESASIIYGSFGQGQAVVSQGAWFVQDHLAFENLGFGATLFGGSETKGTSNDILLDHVTIHLPDGNQNLGLYGNGNGWTIQHSTIDNTGLSGMLLWGDHYTILDDTITNTGLDHDNGYNNHGIYLDASNTTIAGTTIRNFAESAISVRYRNSTIVDNTLSNGNIGIDFFQTDTQPGTAHWTNNTITGTSAASIYVSDSGSAGNTMESFTIADNTLNRQHGVYLNLKPTRGHETVTGNRQA